MHYLAKPSVNFPVLFDLCIKRKNEHLKEQFLSGSGKLFSLTNAYDEKSTGCNLYELHPESLDPLKQEDFIGLYANQMLKGSARYIYDKLLASGKKDGCCYCSDCEPTELDHFLPKSIFPEFSIFPSNLVPTCHECNKFKDDDYPRNNIDYLVHPYYENYAEFEWLMASLRYKDDAPIVIYQISEVLASTDNDLASRLGHQCRKLQLFRRYAYRAMQEVSCIKHRIIDLHTKGGIDAVRQHLEGEAMSRKKLNKNSWQTALYNCLANDEQFCQIGWEL